MSHLSVPLTPATTKPISRITKETTHLPCQRFYKIRASVKALRIRLLKEVISNEGALHWDMGGVVMGLSIGGENAKAARRAPPPPVQEKKDPSVGGLMAKVLASKRRKEAMQDSMTKLREKGKAIQEQSQQPDLSAD